MMSAWSLAMVARAQPDASATDDDTSDIDGTLHTAEVEGDLDADPAPEADPEPAADAEPEYPLLWPGQCTADDPHFDLEKGVPRALHRVQAPRDEELPGVRGDPAVQGRQSKDDALHEAGLETLRAGLTKKVRYERDALDKEHIQMLIDDPDKACEYSRDGRQDLDKKKLD